MTTRMERIGQQQDLINQLKKENSQLKCSVKAKDEAYMKLLKDYEEKKKEIQVLKLKIKKWIAVLWYKL